MANKFCNKPGCSVLVPTGTRFCADHQAASYREQDQARANSAERGYDAAWRRFRRRYLSQHPLCADCQAEGALTVAVEVHHLVKLRDCRARRLDATNVMGLCKPCHSRRTMKGE